MVIFMGNGNRYQASEINILITKQAATSRKPQITHFGISLQKKQKSKIIYFDKNAEGLPLAICLA